MNRKDLIESIQDKIQFVDCDTRTYEGRSKEMVEKLKISSLLQNILSNGFLDEMLLPLYIKNIRRIRDEGCLEIIYLMDCKFKFKNSGSVFTDEEVELIGVLFKEILGERPDMLIKSKVKVFSGLDYLLKMGFSFSNGGLDDLSMYSVYEQTQIGNIKPYDDWLSMDVDSRYYNIETYDIRENKRARDLEPVHMRFLKYKVLI